uniref:Uncharacterized protein n=1 Tax=Utricularia reniformis TaxID=192314 RepID=A0A1Y0B0T3_9LAMI|nr:hypothetical protein AEK19_MT0742 [Utricularia reniformis]ART30984.1 hypothetical protein AEK19_MT0742 [Utricularia reniformis]
MSSSNDSGGILDTALVKAPYLHDFDSVVDGRGFVESVNNAPERLGWLPSEPL